MQDGKNILVIEDNTLLREILCSLLRGNGFHVRACEDGLAALEVAIKENFDIIITDYALPKRINGADLTRHLRLKFGDSIIIGVSSEDRRKEFLDAGADEFVAKPYRYRDMVTLINPKIHYSSLE